MIKIYSKPGCKNCIQVKEYLSSRDVEYEDINLAAKDNREARKYYRSLGIRDLPVITNEEKDWIIIGWNKVLLEELIKI